MKLIRMAIAHAHARSHATSGISRLVEAKKKNPAAKAQQRNVRSFQPAPPGPISARARAIGARRMAKDPKIRRLSLSREAICEPLRRKINLILHGYKSTKYKRQPPRRATEALGSAFA